MKKSFFIALIFSILFVGVASAIEPFFFLDDGEIKIGFAKAIVQTIANHNELLNLAWSVAGHYFDTNLNLNGYNITNADSIFVNSGTLSNTPSGNADLKSLVNKEYVDFAVTSLGAAYYMHDEDDATTNYKLCYLNPSSDAETYIENASVQDGDYLGGWISAPNEAPSKLLKGVYDWYITMEKTSGTKTLRVYWQLVELNSTGSEIAIANSSLSNEIDEKSSYMVPLQLDEDYLLSNGSRIIGKLYADVSGSGNAPSIRIYYQGDTSSRWEIPANTEIFQNIFVPYSDAVKNVDVSPYNLTVNSLYASSGQYIKNGKAVFGDTQTTGNYYFVVDSANKYIEFHRVGASLPLWRAYDSGGALYMKRENKIYWEVGNVLINRINQWYSKGCSQVIIGSPDSYDTPAFLIQDGRRAGDPNLIYTPKLTSTTTEYTVDILADNDLNMPKTVNIGTSTGSGNNEIYIGSDTNDNIHIAATTYFDNAEIYGSGSDLIIAANILPKTNETYNIGSGNMVWNNIYAKNFIDTTPFPNEPDIEEKMQKIRRKPNSKELDHSTLPESVQRKIIVKKGREWNKTVCKKIKHYEFNESSHETEEFEKIICKPVEFVEEIVKIWNGQKWTEIRNNITKQEFKGEYEFTGRSIGDMVSYNTAAIQKLIARTKQQQQQIWELQKSVCNLQRKIWNPITKTCR